MITYTMLGPLFAIFRPVMALLTGILGGMLVQTADEEKPTELKSNAADERVKGLLPRLKAALDYGLVTLPGDIGKALLIGVVIAGILAAVIPPDLLAPYLGQGALSIALMMIVGIPLYVCATASVPLAVGFIMLGASPGAALAFLIAGPATNAATITTISRVLGRKTMVIYLFTVAISAFGGGLALNWMMTWAQTALPVLAPQIHHHGQPGWFDQLCGIILLLVMIRAEWLGRRRSSSCGCGDEEGVCSVSNNEEKVELNITGMNCSHCSSSVTRTLSEISGVTNVQVFLDDGRALIEGSGLDAAAMATAVDGLGFKAQPKA